MITIHYHDLDDIEMPRLLDLHGLICIKGAGDLSVSDFEGLATSLGKPLVTDRHVINDGRFVQHLSEDGLFARGDVGWHNDWSYGRGDYHGTILYNVEGAHHSPTWFCDMVEAPESLKAVYRGCTGLYHPPADLHDACFTARQLSILRRQQVERPFVFPHPRSGIELLYCSIATIQDNHTDLTPIINWAETTAYRHDWADHDILIWDNFRMMHRRSAFTGHRMLWRTQFSLGLPK